MDEENVEKLRICKEEVIPLERIFSEHEIEQSFDFFPENTPSLFGTITTEKKFELSGSCSNRNKVRILFSLRFSFIREIGKR